MGWEWNQKWARMDITKYEIQKKLPLIPIFFVPYLNKNQKATLPLERRDLPLIFLFHILKFLVTLQQWSQIGLQSSTTKRTYSYRPQLERRWILIVQHLEIMNQLILTTWKNTTCKCTALHNDFIRNIPTHTFRRRKRNPDDILMENVVPGYK